MVDPDRLRSLLDRLREEVEHLRRLAAMDPEELLADADRVAAVTNDSTRPSGLAARFPFGYLLSKTLLSSRVLPTLEQSDQLVVWLEGGWGLLLGWPFAPGRAVFRL